MDEMAPVRGAPGSSLTNAGKSFSNAMEGIVRAPADVFLKGIKGLEKLGGGGDKDGR